MISKRYFCKFSCKTTKFRKRSMFWLQCLTLHTLLKIYSDLSDTGDYQFKGQIAPKQYNCFFFFFYFLGALEDLMQNKTKQDKKHCKWHCNEWVYQHNFYFKIPVVKLKDYTMPKQNFLHETLNIIPIIPNVSLYLLKFWMEPLNSLISTIYSLFSGWEL